MNLPAFSFPTAEPDILFFSGGTALHETARELARQTANTLHLITPFDSGGSSAALRKAFNMPALGDVRSRIMALASEDLPGNAALRALFSYRLPEKTDNAALRRELAALCSGSHPLMAGLGSRELLSVTRHLAWLAGRMPEDFPLRRASVGNLILAGGYLHASGRLSPVIARFSRLSQARGRVQPVVNASAHLAVRLVSGEVLVGQHTFTGKEAGAITSPIADIWLTTNLNTVEPAVVRLAPRTAALIRQAKNICFPVGSFYSSVVANLLPQGVGRAVARNTGLKIFVPNLGKDPELLGHTVQTQIQALLRPLLAGAPKARPRDMLTTILADADKGLYPGGLPETWLREQGIRLINLPLVSSQSAPLADPRLLCQALLLVTRADGQNASGGQGASSSPS